MVEGRALAAGSAAYAHSADEKITNIVRTLYRRLRLIICLPPEAYFSSVSNNLFDSALETELPLFSYQYPSLLAMTKVNDLS
jgi:hypothetical protein